MHSKIYIYRFSQLCAFVVCHCDSLTLCFSFLDRFLFLRSLSNSLCFSPLLYVVAGLNYAEGDLETLAS